MSSSRVPASSRLPRNERPPGSPVVVTVALDPVEMGSSRASPGQGGNVNGLTSLVPGQARISLSFVEVIGSDQIARSSSARRSRVA
jgi:hypothetical protein